MDLATNVLERVANPGENTIFAPSSIWTGMGMLYRGLGGRSKQQFARAFGFPLDKRQFEAEVKVCEL